MLCVRINPSQVQNGGSKVFMVFKLCKPVNLIVVALQELDSGAVPMVLCEMNCILGYEHAVESLVLEAPQYLGPARRKGELPR